ncbi:MAG: S-methyl-5'-thioadenosine phosphorylase [Candidatus Pacebacteria bacterium]|nr:S-methyl-5'-thioadenosine phosphorylase [Candidatus Paceibacterota bacterium]
MTANKIKIAIIGGSGIDDPKILKDPQEIEMETPFGKPASKLITGKISGVDVVVLARHGKDHSIMPTKVPFRANIWALKEIGCTHILATTACGSLREEIKPRDLVFMDQFIDFTKHRNLTFFEDKVIHTPMADPFCPKLRELLIKTAENLKISHHKKGTNVTIEGPRFSTRAESHMFRNLGADIINMSTVPEVILARELGICYASIAMATDYDCWKAGEESVTWEMILNNMKHNAENVKKLLLEVIPKVDYSDCTCNQSH